LGKRLKKNKVAVDVINFGEESQNIEKLETFINAVNSSDNSHLVTIPPGPHILSDILMSSPIINVNEDGTSTGSAPSNSTGFPGIDPNLDPELAMAMKLSLEEARQREEKKTRINPNNNNNNNN